MDNGQLQMKTRKLLREPLSERESAIAKVDALKQPYFCDTQR